MGKFEAAVEFVALVFVVLVFTFGITLLGNPV